MKKFLSIIFIPIILTGCTQMMPGITQDIDDAITDQAIGIQIDKAAMQKDTTIDVSVKVMNAPTK